MSRKSFPTNSVNPYHVFNRCINKQWFELPMDFVWDVMSDYLFFVSHAYEIQIHMFVLMMNHFHLMVSAPHGNLSPAMQYFLNQTSRVLSHHAIRINQVWGQRFGRCEIKSSHHALNTYKYIYRNPVEAKIVERVEDYEYSTLYGLTGQRKLFIPLVEDLTLFNDFEGTLGWLNQPVKPENWDAVRKALRRQVYKLPKSNIRNHPMEIDLL